MQFRAPPGRVVVQDVVLRPWLPPRPAVPPAVRQSMAQGGLSGIVQAQHEHPLPPAARGPPKATWSFAEGGSESGRDDLKQQLHTPFQTVLRPLRVLQKGYA
mmetsp:Transcript_30588/g.77259  ORF Transcript_30588/g.77259 Transcript_30588/m.77259 type:complete len:102 (+) Transcript_30588:489-794(+)